ncbi:hypothetical protein MVEN_01162100 [Mycena venus]|uniref:Uncharacterized protein n=1 Tax=Mycena venus TaxID=2733690 RepID=A0A8H7CVG6_9AGAR|nr:hypothetical protein MVEN_01162100 [Mycena venus]
MGRRRRLSRSYSVLEDVLLTNYYSLLIDLSIPTPTPLTVLYRLRSAILVVAAVVTLSPLHLDRLLHHLDHCLHFVPARYTQTLCLALSPQLVAIRLDSTSPVLPLDSAISNPMVTASSFLASDHYPRLQTPIIPRPLALLPALWPSATSPSSSLRTTYPSLPCNVFVNRLSDGSDGLEWFLSIVAGHRRGVTFSVRSCRTGINSNKTVADDRLTAAPSAF